MDLGAITFTKGISLENIANDGYTNYCWAIDRQARSYDVIHGMIRT